MQMFGRQSQSKTARLLKIRILEQACSCSGIFFEKFSGDGAGLDLYVKYPGKTEGGAAAGGQGGLIRLIRGLLSFLTCSQ